MCLSWNILIIFHCYISVCIFLNRLVGDITTPKKSVILKCPLPPYPELFKEVILPGFIKGSPKPLFVFTKHPKLAKMLTKSRFGHFSSNELFDVLMRLWPLSGVKPQIIPSPQTPLPDLNPEQRSANVHHVQHVPICQKQHSSKAGKPKKASTLDTDSHADPKW